MTSNKVYKQMNRLTKNTFDRIIAASVITYTVIVFCLAIAAMAVYAL